MLRKFFSTITFLLFPALLVAHGAEATTLNCAAPFDEGSHYELFKGLKDGQEKILLRYQTTDGLSLESELELEQFFVESKKQVRLKARNEHMAVDLSAFFDREKESYEGAMAIAFALDSAPNHELFASCKLKN